MRMRTKASAGNNKMEVSGWELVGRLCDCILTAAFYNVFEKDTLLSSLRSPSKKIAWSDRRRRKEILRLVYLAYDILLLRKWMWFGSWNINTALSPLCWCLSYGYKYHTQGRIKEGKRLTTMLNIFTSDDGVIEKDAILQFLALMAGNITEHPSYIPEILDSSVDSGIFCYDIYPSSLFEQLPSTTTSTNLTPIYQALDQANKLYTSSPGSGFSGYLSSQTMSADKTLSSSNLFDGLVNSTTSSLNCHLAIPTLPSHPDLITLLHHTSHITTSPTMRSPSDSPTPSSSYYHTPSVWCDVPPRDWSGWCKRLPYITEAGPDTVGHAHFLSRAHLPSCDLEPHPLEPHPPNEYRIDGDSISRAFSAALSRLRQYRQTIIDRYHDEPIMKRHVGLHHLEPITCLLNSAKDTSLTGLSLVDVLYNQCCVVQGTPHYPLLLSLLSHTITPYTHFLSQWLFNGWLDEGEEFGIHSNHSSLQCRDHRYWSEGYTVTEQCTPTFLTQHSHIVVACGKVLNLLRLCCPQHPLCGQVSKRPVVAIATSLEQLKELTQECQEYYNEVKKRVNEEKEQRQHQAEAIEQEAMEKVLHARQEARQALLAAREQEEYILAQHKKQKSEWLLELQTRAMEARQMKVKRETEEKERDRELVAVLVGRDNSLTSHEKKLAEEAKGELIAHYESLSHEAERRRQRAEWRVTRLRLAGRRQQWIEEHNDETLSVIIYEPTTDVETVEEKTSEVTISEDTISEETTQVVSEATQQQQQQQTIPAIQQQQQTIPATQQQQQQQHTEEIPIEEQVIEQQQQQQCTEEIATQEKVEQQQQHSDITSLLMANSTTTNDPVMQPTELDIVTHTSRGLPPPSTIQHLIYPSSSHDVYHTLSSRGQAPPTTIQHLLYPKASEEATPTKPSSSPPTINYPPILPQPYILNHSLLDMMPQSDLLTPVIGPIPMQNGIGTDNMLHPLSYLLDHSISLPLLTQNHLVNSALLDYFLTSCHVTSHFLCLKRFLLLEDGEFAHSLATRLFHKLLYGGGSARMMSPAFLNPLLQSALDSSLHGDSPNTQLLSFAVVDSAAPSHPHAVDALDFLHLRYKVEWPCNIVITDSMLGKYNRIFHLLLQLRRVSWALKIVFTQIHQCKDLGKQQKRQLQIQRHELQHFVDVMQSYITNQIFYLSWKELEDDLANKVHSLDDLIKAHQSFIDKAIFRCLLSKKAAAVMKIIQSIFSSILRFSTTLTTTSLHPSFLHHYNTMYHIHHKFRDAAGLLMKVIIKLVDRGYQPHLEDFLLRLNFNGFYG